MKMRRPVTLLLVLSGLALAWPTTATAGDGTEPPPPPQETQPPPPPAPVHVKHPILMYIPNRIFDVLDIVRLRVRLGPGVAVGARATSLVDVRIGAYSTAYIGLPGPRGQPELPYLVGLENSASVSITPPRPAPARSPSYEPYYGPMEIGAQAQAAIVGFNVGVEPLEVLDLIGGIFFIDIKGDDF